MWCVYVVVDEVTATADTPDLESACQKLIRTTRRQYFEWKDSLTSTKEGGVGKD